MPRIRTLKPEHKQHRKVGPLTHRQYRLWVGMVTEADDVGRLVAEPSQLRALIFPYHPAVTIDHVTSDLADLTTAGLIRLYRATGTQYADFPSWADHQRVERPSKSKLPEYNDSPNAHRTLTEDSVNAPGGSEGIKEGIKPLSPSVTVNGSTGSVSATFEAFYALYPRHVGKGAARRAWIAAVRKTPAETIYAGLVNLLPVLRAKDEQYRPHPATWLNSERWLDEPVTTAPDEEDDA